MAAHPRQTQISLVSFFCALLHWHQHTPGQLGELAGQRVTALRGGTHQVSPEPQPHTGSPGTEAKLHPPTLLVLWSQGTRRQLQMRPPRASPGAERATIPGASHIRDHPAATWVPTMVVCPPVGRCLLTLSSPCPVCLRASTPRMSHRHPIHGTHICMGT